MTSESAPAKLTKTGTELALHIGTGGKADPQVLSSAGGTEGEQIVPRRKKGKVHLPGTEQAVGVRPSACVVYKPYPAPGTAAAAQHPQSAAGVLGDKAQVLSAPGLPTQEEGGTRCQGGGYWVSFAFTKYSPLVTPPNRYMPSVLVLVAVSSS